MSVHGWWRGSDMGLADLRLLGLLSLLGLLRLVRWLRWGGGGRFDWFPEELMCINRLLARSLRRSGSHV
jgi:hypothetical protein